MKVLFDNIVFSLQKRGGISVVWKELISRFLLNGKDDLAFIEYETNKDNVFHEEVNIPSELAIMKHPLSLTINRYLDVKSRNKEHYIFHSSYFRLSSDRNAINVTTVHDFTYEFAYKKRKGSFLHFWQRNRAIRKSDAVVCISESTKHDLKRYLPDVPDDKIHVIYNAASSDYRLLNNDEKIIGINDCLLFVGGRKTYKNGRWLAECIKNTSYKIIFCGDSMDDDEVLFYNKVLGTKRYELKVGLTNEELNRYYNSVKCLVYPSSYEGFGIPIIEAQSAGCPVIAYNSSSIPEVIGETPLLMNELTEKELLDKITLLDDSNIRNKVIKMGIENAKRFSWDRTYEEYRHLYEELLTQKYNMD